MEPLTLIAKRVKETQGIYKGFNTTELYLNGKIKAVIPAMSKQPRRDKKYITINCFNYRLKFS